MSKKDMQEIIDTLLATRSVLYSPRNWQKHPVAERIWKLKRKHNLMRTKDIEAMKLKAKKAKTGGKK